MRYEVVTDKPWSGFNYYEGDYRSRVAINADLPHRLGQLPHLVAHESYPGHHTEHCRKERGLVERAGRTEHTVFLVNTPECLMAEGLADLGVQASVGDGLGAVGGGDPRRPRAALRRAPGRAGRRRGGAAEPGAPGRRRSCCTTAAPTPTRSSAYLQRWSLVSAERAAQQIRFLTDPLWRAYISTYVEGFDLLSPVAGRPAGGPAGRRPVRPAARRAADARGPSPPSCGRPERGRRDPRAARVLGLWTAAWLAVLLLAGLLWVGGPVAAVAGAARAGALGAVACGRGAAGRGRPGDWEPVPPPVRTDTVERPAVRAAPTGGDGRR